MTHDEATTLLARIQEETPTLSVSLSTCRRVNVKRNALVVYSPSLQRRLLVGNEAEWESIKEAWGLTA